MDGDSTTSPQRDDQFTADASAGSSHPEATRRIELGQHDHGVCSFGPPGGPHRTQGRLTVGPGPAPTVAQARRRTAVDWTPFTARIRGRITLAVRSADFRSNMAPVIAFVQRGDMRVVLLRGRLPTAAIVPVADFWFLIQIEDELRRLGWSANRRAPRPEAIAQAIVALQPPDAQSGARRLRTREAALWTTFDRSEPLASQLRGWRSPVDYGW